MSPCMQAAAQASYYLPSYDSRQVANTISQLRDQIEAAKKTHLGKKKFGFSRKPKKSPATQPAQSAAPLTELHTNYADTMSRQQQQLSGQAANQTNAADTATSQLR